jgi:hypothetical protein
MVFTLFCDGTPTAVTSNATKRAAKYRSISRQFIVHFREVSSASFGTYVTFADLGFRTFPQAYQMNAEIMF